MSRTTMRFGAALTALALAASAGQAGPFTAGNIVVTQMGDGTGALTAAATAIFLVEINPTTGAIVQTIALPTAVSGTNRALTVRGSSTSAGHVARSVDGRFLTMAGFDAIPGTTPLQTTTSETINRVIARIDANGVIDTTTALSDAYSGDDIRLAVTTTGTDLWTAGTGGAPPLTLTAGVRYTTLGASTTVQLASSPTNIRIVGIFNNQLYMTSATQSYQGLSAVGTGLPTTAGETITPLPGFPIATGPSNYDFFFSDSNTVYIADDTASTAVGGIQKWTFDSIGGIWSKVYTLNTGLTAANSGCRGVTGQVTRNGVVLWATESTTGSASTGNRIITVTDTGAASAFTAVGNPAPTNTTYRGIALAPAGGTPVACYANCDSSTIAPCLNVNDFTCFLNQYSAGSSYANCDASTIAPVLNVNDFTCFLNTYGAGCSNPCATP